MKKTKARGRGALKRHALQRRRNKELRRIEKLIVKLMPVFRTAKPDLYRHDHGDTKLRLWSLRPPGYDPRKPAECHLYICELGQLRWETSTHFDPPPPIGSGIRSKTLRHLTDYRKRLEALHHRLTAS